MYYIFEINGRQISNGPKYQHSNGFVRVLSHSRGIREKAICEGQHPPEGKEGLSSQS
jgi:hypothetical protein